jgi:uncharacterized membrane protein (Fun14 family)
MVSIGAPDLSTTFLVAAILPLILGFIVGLILRSVFKIGIALIILFVILILLGLITPDQILKPVLSALKGNSSTIEADVQKLASYLPYSSITFIIGLAIGFLKG